MDHSPVEASAHTQSHGALCRCHYVSISDGVQSTVVSFCKQLGRRAQTFHLARPSSFSTRLSWREFVLYKISPSVAPGSQLSSLLVPLF